ncbi:MAG TPA: type II toxin-antitoxin system PemK/MazF family toxin [Ignavibacteria bacterium]|nr:type II toxin-antitoxin system PemK/MazF family toxin [Ignavibacteria bacterium]
MKSVYEPGRGDVIWLDLNPQVGREQAGRRPVLVMSPKIYNQKAGLAVICPITSTIKNYPYVVKIPDELKVRGVILSDQIKSLDWNARKAEYICKMPDIVFNTVIEKLNTLIQ